MKAKDIRDELSKSEIESLLSDAKSLLTISREVTARLLTAGFSIEQKSDKSLVTSADTEIEKKIREEISRKHPEHGILGEEFPETQADADFKWILDPIDGTEDFTRGLPFWGTIIALHYKGQPLIGVIDHPALDLTISGARGLGAYKSSKGKTDQVMLPDFALRSTECLALTVRANFERVSKDGPVFDQIVKKHQNFRTFRTVYGHTQAILGNLDAMLEFGVGFWDVAASQVLVEEAGGTYLPLTGENGKGFGALFGQKEVVERLNNFF